MMPCPARFAAIAGPRHALFRSPRTLPPVYRAAGAAAAGSSAVEDIDEHPRSWRGDLLVVGRGGFAFWRAERRHESGLISEVQLRESFVGVFSPVEGPDEAARGVTARPVRCLPLSWPARQPP